jgi:hypothetical protein
MRVALLVLIPSLFAADPPKLPEPFRTLSDLAGAAPPEFAADALLRMAESKKLADPSFRRAMIEQAFQLAASAKFALKMQGVAGATTDTASGSLNDAYALSVDALSLQSRAVRDMLPLDPAKARALFAEITRPTLTPLTCDDALVYDPSAYYQTLSAVVNTAFTPQEKAKEAPFNLMLDEIGLMNSPSQLAPLAAAIESANVPAAERDHLRARFNSLLENMPADDRSFGAAPEQYRPKGHDCAAPKLDHYWQSATAKQLLDAGKKLRVGASGQLLSDSDRSSLQWQQDLADYLNLIAGWTSDQEPSNAIYYHERCLVYTSLLDLVPAGPESEKILAEYVDFIGNSSLYEQSPAEWFAEPHTLLDRARGDRIRHTKVLNAFEHSGNPVLVLEVALDRNFDTQ